MGLTGDDPLKLKQLQIAAMVSGLFLIVFVIGADSFIISPLLPTLAHQFHLTISETALAVTTYAIGYAGGAPIFGPLGERYPHKWLLLIGSSGFILGSLIDVFAGNFAWFCVGRLLAGLGAALTLPNVWATLGQCFQGPQLNRLMGITMAALSLSIAIGVPIGAFMTQLANWRLVFGPLAALAMVALLGISRWVPVMAEAASPAHDYSRSFRQIWHLPVIRGVLSINFVWMLGFYLIYTFLGTKLALTWHLATGQVGLAFVVYGLSNFSASFFSGRVTTQLGALPSLRLNALLSGVAIVVMLLSGQSLVWFMLGLTGLAVVQGLSVPAISTLILTYAPNQRTTAMALNSSLLYVGLTLGSSLGGWLETTWGFVAIVVVAVIALTAPSGVAHWLLKHEVKN